MGHLKSPPRQKKAEWGTHEAVVSGQLSVVRRKKLSAVSCQPSAKAESKARNQIRHWPRCTGLVYPVISK